MSVLFRFTYAVFRASASGIASASFSESDRVVPHDDTSVAKRFGVRVKKVPMKLSGVL